MEMTIDESISIFKNKGKYSLTEKENEAKKIAIDIMRKYQKIEQIVNHWACCGNPTDSMIAISEVLKDDRN